MRKQELIHLHALCARLRRHVETRRDVSADAFSRYDDASVGPAFGIAGPLESYEPFPRSTKLLMTFLMWVGRIEIIPVLVLLTPSYWRS